MEGSDNIDRIIIYTDGGCRGNNKAENIGGWGVVLKYKNHIKELYGNDSNTTNNKMELTAVIIALKNLKTNHIPITVYSDSSYVVNGISKWVEGWSRNGWKKSDKKPVLNKDLWVALLELKKMQKNIEFQLVKGHADNEGNNRADELVNIAMDERSLNN